jgi:AraC-like DNA-binding protein
MAEIHAVSLLQIAPFLARCGIDVLDFFSREEIAPNIFQAHDTWFPRAECLRLANALARVTGDPCAGANLGHSARLHDFGEFGRLVTRAETVAGACQAVIANLGLVHRGSRLAAIQEGDWIFLRFSLEGALTHDPWQFILASLAVMRNILLLSGEADMVKIRLSAPYARRWAALEASLGERLEFGRDADGLLIPRSLLEKPLAVAHDTGRGLDALQTTVRAAQIIAAMLPEIPVRIDTVAVRLGLKKRMLQRRLAECGVTFSDLVDVTRRDAALHNLSSGCQNLLELALDLGYSDQAHFTRSFRRWTGTTPSAFMRQ